MQLSSSALQMECLRGIYRILDCNVRFASPRCTLSALAASSTEYFTHSRYQGTAATATTTAANAALSKSAVALAHPPTGEICSLRRERQLGQTVRFMSPSRIATTGCTPEAIADHRNFLVSERLDGALVARAELDATPPPQIR